MPPLDDRPATTGWWRSLEERADSAEFRRFLEREFPYWTEASAETTSRRGFLKLMGASVALAGMVGCRWPTEEILPFSERPDGYTPGMPLRYATAMDLNGSATGLLVTGIDGRPVKIEGNPLHPESLGASGAPFQASLLELYDPDRGRPLVRREKGEEVEASWGEFEAFARERFGRLAESGGRGLRVLAGADSSPSLAAMREQLARAYPDSRWYEYEACSRDNEREGTALLFGAPQRTRLALDRAGLIVSLDEDFLLQHPTALRNARDWVRGRDPDGDGSPRLVVFESHYSVTGAAADRRVPLAASAIPPLALRMAAELFLRLGVELPREAEPLRPVLERALSGSELREADAARALPFRRGDSLILAGPGQPAEVHALVHLMNVALGNVGRTVSYVAAPDPERPHHEAAIRELAAEIDAGAVDMLLVLGGNPAFDAPADLDLGSRLAEVETTIRLGLHEDETSRACDWHLPRAHYLESWGDGRAWTGELNVVQPLIEPLHGGRSAIELLALLLGDEETGGYEIVRRTFRELHGESGFEKAWRKTLHDGILAGSGLPESRPAPRAAGWADRAAAWLDRPSRADGSLELVFLDDPAILDGRFANNGWLQELPDPITKLTWDNALLLSPADAEARGLRQGDGVRVSRGERSVELPVFILPGQAENTAAVHLGYGRSAAGRVGDGVGTDVYPLRTGPAAGWAEVTLEPTGRRHELATTQDHWAIDRLGAAERERRSHELLREVNLEEYRHDPVAAMHHGHHPEPVQLWREHEYEGHRWGMAVDLDACIGCNACVVACQAENNIPVVGKREVANGREMHWIRVDRYFSGDPAAPGLAHQPVTCHHCENAPCEGVCPVAATVHDGEGLNVMVYNRCIGTRYCSNNCPYKVRRFNYFNNHKDEGALEKMIYNPEVTVRSRGVMEKCTFCVQRINSAKIRAKNDGRPVVDGEIVTACQQACPTGAIVFGDLNDPSSRVRRLHEHPRAYALIEEFNIRPRTRYLARVRNRGSARGPDHSGGA